MKEIQDILESFNPEAALRVQAELDAEDSKKREAESREAARKS